MSCHPRTIARSPRAGFTLIEVAVAMVIVTVILLATTMSLQKEAEQVTDLQRLTYAERQIQDFYSRVEERLDFAQGIDATTTLSTSLSAGATGTMLLEDAFGFPFEGTVVVEPGGASAERVTFATLDAPNDALDGLTRAVRSTAASSHPGGSIVAWEGVCSPVENQTAPPAGTFDGLTDDLRGNLFFRGDGMGFAYRRPVDPANNGVFIDAGGVRWGAQVGSTNTLDGCAALVFQPTATFTEADRAFDINRDGDLDDVFDLGRIVDLSWDATDVSNGTHDVTLLSAMVLQEQNAYASDLDSDGFADPIFFWNPDSGRLRIRLFVLMGDVRGREVVKRFENVLYLRNGAAE
ncbi:MAG: prepilin-type N-terminal cleavage/methylation domain-containing protein [Planctomycetota bacterium]